MNLLPFAVAATLVKFLLLDVALSGDFILLTLIRVAIPCYLTFAVAKPFIMIVGRLLIASADYKACPSMIVLNT